MSGLILHPFHFYFSLLLTQLVICDELRIGTSLGPSKSSRRALAAVRVAYVDSWMSEGNSVDMLFCTSFGAIAGRSS